MYVKRIIELQNLNSYDSTIDCNIYIGRGGWECQIDNFLKLLLSKGEGR